MTVSMPTPPNEDRSLTDPPDDSDCLGTQVADYWIQRLRLNDYVAFVPMMYPKLKNICASILTDGQDCEQIALDTLMTIPAAISRIHTDQQLYTWLKSVATNRCIDTKRRKKPESMEDLEVGGRVVLIDDKPTPEESMLVAAIRQMQLETLNQAMSTLTSEQRQIINEKLVHDQQAELTGEISTDDKSFGDISAILDISKDTAISRYYRAISNLRQSLAATEAFTGYLSCYRAVKSHRDSMRHSEHLYTGNSLKGEFRNTLQTHSVTPPEYTDALSDAILLHCLLMTQDCSAARQIRKFIESSLLDIIQRDDHLYENLATVLNRALTDPEFRDVNPRFDLDEAVKDVRKRNRGLMNTLIGRMVARFASQRK